MRIAYSTDRKHSDSWLAPYERRLAGVLLRWAPGWLESHHCTLLTLPWSALVLIAGALARRDSRWLWAVSALVVLQYATDAIDGKLGKIRNAGLVRWGYYMDHLLDYVFLCSILLAYAMLLPDRFQYLITLIVAVSGGFMVSAFLARAVTGVLTISYWKIGPVEMRIVFIGINVWLGTVGKAYMLDALPYVIGAALVALSGLAYKTQRTLWTLDRGAAPETEAADVVARRSVPLPS